MPSSIQTKLGLSDDEYPEKAFAVGCCGLSWPSHFNSWCRLVSDHKRLLVVASRDHGKTTFFDRILPITRICLARDYHILVVSYSDTQVLKIGSSIKDTFESKPKLKEFRPRSQDDWSKSRLVFLDGCSLDTLTFGSSGRGGHYDLILVDDPVKDFGGMNPDDQSQYFTRSLIPMCKPDGQIIVTGNYVYDNDLIDRIEKNKEYHTFKFPAIIGGKPLWPEYWSLDKLEVRRREIEASDDPLGFRKEYLLEKVDYKSQFFKRGMFSFYDPANLPDRLSKVASLDPAISASGDATAIMVTGTGENKTYLLDHRNIRTDNVQDIVDTLFELMKTHEVPYVQIETIGFQKMLKHWIREEQAKRNFYFGIEEIKTHKKSKEARIMALQPRIQSGKLLFHPSLQDEIIAQFISFPRGQHDDMIDALSFQVGKWDNPDPVDMPIPGGSFEWWKKQNFEVVNDWRGSLGLR